MQEAFDRANIAYPTCIINNCMRFAGDPNLVLKTGATPDSQPPTTSITSPLNGAVVSGTGSTVSVTASDNVGVTKVELLRDGTLLSSSTTLPYQFTWNTMTVANGSHTLLAKAYDAAGNIGTSAQISVSVSNAPDVVAPTVIISSPANGASTSKKTAISATGSDNVNVVSMRALVDNTQACVSAKGSLSCSINNIKYAKGSHQITVEASDAAGNKGSAMVNVTFR
jgi:hypothetical protein